MSGTINVSPYPSNNRTHGVFGVIDPTGANTGQANYPTLLFAQMLSTGTATPNLAVLMPSGQDNLRLLLGAGSLGARIAARYAQRDPFATVYLVPLADDPASVAATLAVTFSGTVSAASVLPLYVDGINVPVACAAAQTAAQTAAAVAAAILALADLPVTAAQGTGGNTAVVTFTAKSKGLLGNGLDVRLGCYGEPMPPGLTVTGILYGTGTQLSGGLQNPSIQTALSNLPAVPYDYYVMPYLDGANLASWKSFMNDQVGRWSYLQMLYGGGFAAFRGTLSAATTFGLAQNDPSLSILPAYDAPEAPEIWAADSAGNYAASLRADPALPLQELVLGVLPPPVQNRFDAIGERNTLLYSGMSTFEVVSNAVVIDRAITTYQLAPSGAVDTSYLDVETRYSLAALIRDMKTFLQTTYARKKLVADGTNIAGGSNMVTSQTVLASAWGRYATYCNNGQAQNYATFKANSLATNAGNGQVSLLLPFDLPNQLRQIVMVIDFLKS